MDTTLIAKILPTKQNGKRTIGTGYPVGPNLVITARHVVCFDERDTNIPITVEWPDIKTEATPSYKDDNAEVLFEDSRYDIALIKCTLPPHIDGTPFILSRRFPEAHEKWKGFGYPRIGKDEETKNREKIPVLGEFHPADKSSHKINLTSKSDALENSGWKGVSGAPVFQGNWLYAVIVATPTERQECFTAVSIPWMLENNTTFRKAVGLDEPEVNFTEAIAHLQKYSSAKQAVFKQITKVKSTLKDSPEEIIRYLVLLPIPELLKNIVDTQRNQSKSVCRELATLVTILLPSLCGVDCASQIRAGKGNSSVGIIQIPYATDISAEMVMACADKLPADIKVIELEYGSKITPGKHRLALSPESGPDDGTLQQQNMEDDLYNRLSGNQNITTIELGVDEHLFRKNPNKQSYPYSHEEQKELTKSWLENDAEANRRGFYWLFNLAAYPDYEDQLRQLAKNIKTSYPHITLLSLQYDMARQKSEDKNFNYLKDIQGLK